MTVNVFYNPSRIERKSYQMIRVAAWLAINPGKIVLFRTNYFKNWQLSFYNYFPHLIVEQAIQGLTIKFPACNK